MNSRNTQYLSLDPSERAAALVAEAKTSVAPPSIPPISEYPEGSSSSLKDALQAPTGPSLLLSDPNIPPSTFVSSSRSTTGQQKLTSTGTAIGLPSTDSSGQWESPYQQTGYPPNSDAEALRLKDGIRSGSSPGYPDNNPKTAFGLAKSAVHLVPPAAITGMARAFANGAGKYGPYNWREKKISSTVYYAACMRHLMAWYDRVDEGDLAPDSGVHHLDHAQACIAMIQDTLNSELLNDDRPPRVTRFGEQT